MDSPTAPATAPPGTALYLHFPFCAAKCTYCDFFSLPAEGHALDRALAALEAEARRRAPRSPRTVFLGGGTPSLHRAEDLRRFLDALDDATGFRASAREVTVECNPESLDRAKAAALREAGATRLSIGVQSLRPRVLEAFGRVHDADQGLRALDAARAGGFDQVSADLIYAAPGTTPAEWETDLARVLDAGVDHLSAYNLAYEAQTPFHRWREQGRVVPVEEEAELAMFEATAWLAAERGLERYEVSNYARPGAECRHNQGYWRNAEYVGIGPSAVSKIGATRFGNARELVGWRAAIEEGRPAAGWSETPDPLARLGETWWLGLRLVREGVHPAEARATAGCSEDDPDPALETARRLAGHDLLAERDGRFVLTERGLPLADAVAREFLPTGD